MKVKLIKNYKDPNGRLYDISYGKEYDVIGIEANDYRLVGNDGKPVLYYYKCFKITDTTEPIEWITDYGEDGERYSYPPVLNRVGFFEDYFDNIKGAIKTFDTYLKKITT